MQNYRLKYHKINKVFRPEKEWGNVTSRSLPCSFPSRFFAYAGVQQSDIQHKATKALHAGIHLERRLNYCEKEKSRNSLIS